MGRLQHCGLSLVSVVCKGSCKLLALSCQDGSDPALSGRSQALPFRSRPPPPTSNVNFRDRFQHIGVIRIRPIKRGQLVSTHHF